MASAAHNLHLNQIATFVAVVDAGSFRGAAERMNISQSAVSVRIQQIEERLGVPVLHRTTRQVQPTAEGLRFYVVAKGALREMERIASELREEAVLQRGLVTVAAMPSIAGTLLPVAMAALARELPGITIRQIDVDSARILEMARKGEVDLGISTDEADQQDVAFWPLFFEECVLVIPVDTPRRKGPDIALADALAWPLFVSPRGSRLRQVIDDAFRAAGLTLDPAQEAWQMLTLQRLVGAGLGAAIMPYGAASGLDPARYRILRFTERFGRTVGVLRARNRSEAPASKAIRKFLIRNAREGGLVRVDHDGTR